MFADIRRDISHYRRSREDKALKDAEKKRRLSYIRMRRSQESEAQEKELRKQTHEEITAFELAREAKRARVTAEKELKATKPSAAKTARALAQRIPGAARTAMKIARGTVKVARTTSRVAGMGTSPEGAKRIHTLVFGQQAPSSAPSSSAKVPDDDFIFGRSNVPQSGRSKKSTRDFIFGGPGGS